MSALSTLECHDSQKDTVAEAPQPDQAANVSPDEKPYLSIRPTSGWAAVVVRELWNFRDLLFSLAGRLQRLKGMHHLVDAMPAVLEKHPDAHAVIVSGDHAFQPEDPAFLQGRITALNLDSRVILAGLQHNVPELMQAIDVVVHAPDAEPFGIVVVEAMALGKPVVATNTAGPAEIIQDGVNGRLWSPGNMAQLVQATLEAIRIDYSVVASRAILRSQQFSTPNYAANVINAIHEVRKEDAQRDRI